LLLLLAAAAAAASLSVGTLSKNSSNLFANSLSMLA